jgi:hypothetical protein
MKRVFFLLIALVALVPLTLNFVLLMQGTPQPDGRRMTIWIVCGVVAATLAAAGLLAGWLSKVFEGDLARFRNAVKRVARGDYRVWVRHGGASREAHELAVALNRLSGNLAVDEDHLKREEEESGAVATQSLEFIEELLRARVPLAKHHPGLVESYSRELVAKKKLAETAPEQRGFMSEVMSAVLGRKGREHVRRRDPRYLARRLWLAAPVAARITDLSTSGMCIESLQSPQGRDPRPFIVADGEERLTLSASVKWCRLVSTARTQEGESAAVYRAGIEFVEDLPNGVRDKLLRTLDAQNRFRHSVTG